MMKYYGSETTVYSDKEVPAILRWIEPDSRVLEFGPAYGYMTRYMSETLKCDVTCVELNPQMKSVLEQYAGKVIIANIDSDNWDQELSGKYDYIVFSDVLEHLRNPLETIRKVSTFGDCVLTSIPNIGHSSILLNLLSGKFIYQTYGLLDDTHIHFFTRQGMDEIMNACLFESVDENSRIMKYPSKTEFLVPYARHLSAALAICRKPDSSVYQFVNKWERRSSDLPVNKSTPIRHSFVKSAGIILWDSIKYYFKRYKRLVKKA